MPMIATQVPGVRSTSALLWAVLLLETQVVVQARIRDLNEAEGRELAITALDPSARKLPKLRVDLYQDPNAPAPDFYKFEITWDNPEGSAIVAHFAVNRATGDVWQLVVCRRMHSADLKRLQRSMRKRIGLSRKQLRELGAKAPCER